MSRTPVMGLSDPFALRQLVAQAHKRPWVSLGWVRRDCRYAERASRFIKATESSKGMVFPYKPLIGLDLMRPAGCQMSKHFSAAFTEAR